MVSKFRKLPTWITFYWGMFISCLWQKFYAKWTSCWFVEDASCNKVMNVATACWQWGNSVNESSQIRWTRRRGWVSWPAQSPDLNFLHFLLWHCMKYTLYHKGKQLVEGITKMAGGIGTHLLGTCLEWCLALCIYSQGGDFENLLEFWAFDTNKVWLKFNSVFTVTIN